MIKSRVLRPFPPTRAANKFPTSRHSRGDRVLSGLSEQFRRFLPVSVLRVHVHLGGYFRSFPVFESEIQQWQPYGTGWSRGTTRRGRKALCVGCRGMFFFLSKYSRTTNSRSGSVRPAITTKNREYRPVSGSRLRLVTPLNPSVGSGTPCT